MQIKRISKIKILGYNLRQMTVMVTCLLMKTLFAIIKRMKPIRNGYGRIYLEDSARNQMPFLTVLDVCLCYL
uniref:Uncharacterized protein n=1 Tax=Schistosoma japonicum TaxID=6182 RepID=Q5C0L4_SCHJA|nr:unknown [Schistosoma japonicum]